MRKAWTVTVDAAGNVIVAGSWREDEGRLAARHAVAELRHARAKDPAPDVRTAAKGALARLE